MNPQVKRLSNVITVLFLVLAVACTFIQFFAASSLNKDPRNTRALYRLKYVKRGDIIAGEQLLATSVADQQAHGYRQQYLRQYSPEANMYAHLLGYIGGGGAPFGLEYYYHQELMGEKSVNPFAQTWEYFTGQSKRGDSIKLTIVPQIQQAAFNALGERKGAAVMLNYQTGEILAAVSKPSFDLGQFQAHPEDNEKIYQDLEKDPWKPLLNRAFEAELAPGSTFKIITSAAIFENSELNPDSKVDGPVCMTLPGTAGQKLCNIYNSRCGDGKPTLSLAFEQSCNTPFAKLALDIGAKQLQETAEKFGFNNYGEKSGKNPQVPLPVAKSVFPLGKAQSESGVPVLAQPQLAQSSIGQFEVRTNPLQMASVAGTIANNGKRVKPFLVKAHLDAQGKEVYQETGGEVLNQAVSEQTAQKIQAMMRKVMQPGALGKAARVEGVDMGAKSGTADIDGTYTDGWFVGFANLPNLPLAFAVVIEGDSKYKATPFGYIDAAPVVQAMVRAAQEGR